MTAFNRSETDDAETRFRLMWELFGKETEAWIEPPFYCCYGGTNVTLGEHICVNMNCSFIDDGKIAVGKKVMFGANAVIAAVWHPIKPDMRKYMYSAPVTIGDNCRIGARLRKRLIIMIRFQTGSFGFVQK